MNTDVPSLFDPLISDVGVPAGTVSKILAEKLFILFKQHPLFHWNDSNNGCEGRADAICILLDEWKIPNEKAWIFSGYYLKKQTGQLKQNWNYHVAPILPVEEEGQIIYYVLDPATAGSLQLINEWAAAITEVPQSYYCIRQPHWYIFPAKNISTSKWHTRNKQNRKWMIQCLAGINGLSATGKAKLCFNKGRLKNVTLAFEKAKKDKHI
jgi:hypothetical protein